ncbi:hypothetical protein MKX03_003683 [Papaver bracteatum]|nr:hypothetical protein MKX03_003683 [Papaver bracteatum]
MKLEPAESDNDLIADQFAETNKATTITKDGTLIEEIQSCRDLRTAITKEEEVSKEMNKEMTVSTETREVPTKNEEGPNMNIHEKPTNNTPCEEEPIENMNGMVLATNSETTINATEDARALDNLSEGNNLFSTPFESVSKCDISDKEKKSRKHEGEHIVTQAITTVEEAEHINNANILKEGVKKLGEFNIQERSYIHIQIPQHEEIQVESVTASIGKINNTSESFVEDQSQMKTDIKQEAKGLIPEASDTKNEEERSREVDLGKAAEANTATLLEDQKAECGQYKESISETEPSMSDFTLEFEKESFVKKKNHWNKSHNILSGVGSKFKHSIAKVKKAITG